MKKVPDQNGNHPLALTPECSDPWETFKAWLADAKSHEISDANAMSLATVDQFGMPNVRMVLMKSFDRDGCVFYTNLASAKGTEVLETKKAAICFHWKTLKRQVRFRGDVNPVSVNEADEYFASRTRTSQLGAWASKQSRPLKSKRFLLQEVTKYALKFGVQKVPRPEHWSGFRLVPCCIEFYQQGEYDLSDRCLFTFDRCANLWTKSSLQP